MKSLSSFKIGFNDESAIVTHYLQNRNTRFEKPFEKDAKRLLGYDFQEDKYVDYVEEDQASYNLFPELFSVPFPAPENTKFTFIDLFAGIGGFRIAMQNLGGKCVYSSEWDAQAQKTSSLCTGRRRQCIRQQKTHRSQWPPNKKTITKNHK